MRASHTENPSKAIDDKFLSAGYVRRFIVTLLILWTASIGLLFAWSIWEQVQQVQSVALAEARADVDRDEAFRLWISSHGGVYVPIDSRTAPNPLLASVPERDVVTPGGQHLTLMNSAYVLRQISHEYADLQIASSHLTSLKPLRPENAPDEWERAALMAFQKGQPEVYQFTEINGAPVLRLMRPIMTEESCLKCHAQQGLSVGSIRGGGAVILPTGRLWSATRGYITGLGLGIGALWVLGLLGILWSSQRFSKDAHERRRAEVSLRETADTLMERNQELRAQKEILQTIFDHIPVMINLISEEGKPSLVNHEWERTLGWTLEEIREQNVDYAAAMYQDPVQRQRMIDSLVYPSNQWEDFKTRVKDGRVIDTSWMVVRLSGGNNIGIGLDITQRVATERDLKRRMVELEALEEISAAVRAGEKREEVLPAVLDQIMAVFNAQGVSLGLLDPQRDCIVIEMGRGGMGSRQRRARALLWGDRPAGRRSPALLSQ